MDLNVKRDLELSNIVAETLKYCLEV